MADTPQTAKEPPRDPGPSGDAVSRLARQPGEQPEHAAPAHSLPWPARLGLPGGPCVMTDSSPDTTAQTAAADVVELVCHE